MSSLQTPKDALTTPQIILSPLHFGQNRTHSSFDIIPHKSVSLATPSFRCASLNSFQFVLTTVTELSRTECNINIPHTVYSACQAKIRSFMKIDYLNLPIPPVIMESLTIITPNLKNSIHPLIKVSSCFWWLSEMLAFLILTTVRGKPVDFGIQPQKASYHNNFVVLAGWGCQPQVQWVLCLFTAWEGSVLQAEELTSSQHAGRGEALWAHRKCWWERRVSNPMDWNLCLLFTPETRNGMWGNRAFHTTFLRSAIIFLSASNSLRQLLCLSGLVLRFKVLQYFIDLWFTLCKVFCKAGCN